MNEQELAGFLARSGQFLMPMVDLIEQCRLACDELIDVTGRAAIEAVLQLSAGQAAGGPAQQGKRRAWDVVFGAHQPVQRCRAHKLRNVLDHLPKEQRDQVKSVLRTAWKLDAKAGMARIRKLAEWLKRDHPSAAACLLECLEECFTINRLGVPPSLMRCLATTNIIESPHAGVRIQTHCVTHWQNGKMVIRWLASAFIRTEKRFNKIMGHRDQWILETIRNDAQPATGQVAA
ncbi:MAG: transposase [Acidobacteriaceae bacterium]